MTADSACVNLTHHFLIAMPGLEDGIFSRSVIYLCEHNARGAMGLIINKPADLQMSGLFEKVDLPLHRQDLLQAPVLLGGPVQGGRVAGTWPGLEQAALHDGRDLAVTTDFRQVLAEVLERHLRLDDRALARILPDGPGPGTRPGVIAG